ncbi:MAG: class I SAM-dependent RNA methyltransferase [Peptoniphilus sp.]|nr:class I SAM-dependent RNA methyltransferase [Peptoniphilus sp.]MDD7362583.1 class I SAM-dependent RNA methyltransferase [Bacillota bacterium]MDY6045018.1 class I SAM-dependent RNA methyltransferase [Peptoniphilus sp.]
MINLEATANIGMEAVLKREIQALGLENIRVSDGLVSMSGEMEDIARLNLHLRTAERVHWVLKRFRATTFTELFDGVYDLPWPDIMPRTANFVTEAKSKKSGLFSLSDIQRISEKAIVNKMQTRYKTEWFEKNGARYRIGIRIVDDIATIYIDTSGDGLHNRGYRQRSVKAPLTETLASGLVQLSYWNKNRMLVDPFCGSGTILIEAILLARHIAPGLNRRFDFEYWNAKGTNAKEMRKEAFEMIDYDSKLELYGFDVDPKAIEASRINLDGLGLSDDVTLIEKDIAELDLAGDYGVIITNPPYGKRIEDRESVRDLNRSLGDLCRALPTWSHYIITADRGFEKGYGKKADRKRKLFNGNIRTDYYQYYGPKP